MSMSMARMALLAVVMLTLARAENPQSGADYTSPTREEVIRGLSLIPMNDGACIGYYREMYACAVSAQTEKPRAAATGIYYLMSGGLMDPWHKTTFDEILVYHAGATMNQLLIHPDGSLEKLVLGPNPKLGHKPQIVIPKGTWMGFRIADDRPEAWGLYSVFCSPGFHLDDIVMTNGPDLGLQFPAAVEAMKEMRMYE